MIQTLLSVGSRYPVDRKKIRACVARVLQEHGVQDAVVSVSIVGVRRMAQLHEKHMKLKGPTDVLSFPQHDPSQPAKTFPHKLENEELPLHFGDVVVCYSEAVDQARTRGHLVDDQICTLVEHGLLHLLGFHHD